MHDIWHFNLEIVSIQPMRLVLYSYLWFLLTKVGANVSTYLVHLDQFHDTTVHTNKHVIAFSFGHHPQYHFIFVLVSTTKPSSCFSKNLFNSISSTTRNLLRNFRKQSVRIVMMILNRHILTLAFVIFNRHRYNTRGIRNTTQLLIYFTS